MKNVLFLINNLNRGGAERQWMLQINYLHEIHNGVFLGTLWNDKPESYASEVKLPKENQVVFQYTYFFDPRLYMRIRRFVKKNNIQVIYSTLEISNIVARLTKIFVPSVKIVIRESGTSVVNKNGKPTFKPLKYKVFDFFMNWMVEKIVLVSEEMKILARSWQGIYAKKFSVLSNGVKVPKQLTSKDSAQKIRILTIGSMNWVEKAYEYLIEAVGILKRDDVELVLVGGGSRIPIYKNFAKKFGVDKQTTFTGQLGTSAVEKQYANADIFVFTSISEGSPNVILEAMSHGVPVISTRVGSSPEMIEHAQTGYLVPKQDAAAIAAHLKQLIEDEKLRKQIGAAGYERVKDEFDMPIVARRIVDILGLV